MKSASEVLAKHDKGVRHYHNDSPYVRKCDALMAMGEYAKQVSVEPEVDVKTAGIDLANMVKQDIENRIEKGVNTYGERLKTNNGRIALQDAYEEILDLALYIKQELEERKSRFSD